MFFVCSLPSILRHISFIRTILLKLISRAWIPVIIQVLVLSFYKPIIIRHPKTELTNQLNNTILGKYNQIPNDMWKTSNFPIMQYVYIAGFRNLILNDCKFVTNPHEWIWNWIWSATPNGKQTGQVEKRDLITNNN